MIQKKSDDAVSPVIGVMLMLVITVVVAGVIAAFGTGMVGETESAPNVVLDVKILEYYQALPGSTLYDSGGPDFQIRHVSGDPLDTGDIEIQMSWKHEGTAYYSAYSAASFKQEYSDGFIDDAIPAGYGKLRMQPMYVKLAENSLDEMVSYEYGSTNAISCADYYFGDAVLTTGMRLTATADCLVNGAVGSIFMDVIFNNGDVLTEDVTDDKGIMEVLPVGTPVQITILHIPSNTIIYDKEVVVQ